jgi:hypothetical protein
VKGARHVEGVMRLGLRERTQRQTQQQPHLISHVGREWKPVDRSSAASLLIGRLGRFLVLASLAGALPLRLASPLPLLLDRP